MHHRDLHKQCNSYHILSSAASVLPNEDTVESTQRLPRLWDILTSHDRDLQKQKGINDKVSLQMTDIIGIISLLQEKIDALKTESADGDGDAVQEDSEEKKEAAD